MDNSTNRPQKTGNSTESHVADSASDLLNESRKLANELYQKGVGKMGDAEDMVKDTVKEYSDQLVKKIHEKPLTSVLVAAGVGLLLSSLLRK